MLAAISINEIAEFFENLPSFWYYIGGGILLVLFFWAAIDEGVKQAKRETQEKAEREAERVAAELAEKERIEKMPLIEEDESDDDGDDEGDDYGGGDDEGEDDDDASFYDKYLGEEDNYYIKTHASQFGRIDWMDKTR